MQFRESSGLLHSVAALSLLVALALVFTGCSITGSWKRVRVDPPGVPFPVEHVTFGADRSYTASWSHEGSPRTSTGMFDWNGMRLDIHQSGMQPRSYRARRRLDGKLELIYGQGKGAVTAVLERTNQ